MTNAPTALEQRLTDAYAAQAKCYDLALSAVTCQKPEDTSGYQWVMEMQTALNDVAALDAAMAEDKEAWRRAGRSASEPLRAILETLAEHIRILSESLDERVARLTERRQQLLPELDAFIRQRRMLHAYDKFAKPIGNA
jgi:hypothetical protein